MAAPTKTKKVLTDRQKRKIEWLKKNKPENRGLGGETGAKDAEQPPKPKKPRLDTSRKPSPQEAKELEAIKSKVKESAARGFKLSVSTLKADNPGDKPKEKDSVKTNHKQASETDKPSNKNIIEPGTTDDDSENDTEVAAPKPAVTVRDILGLNKKEPEKPKKVKKHFYVLFVGNLPYDVDAADIAHYFCQAGEVKDVRPLTNEKGSKGCAYVEFYTEAAHKSALMLHHTQMKGRTINVEFTSAGRKGTKRDARIKEKNEKGARFKMGLGLAVRKNRPVQQGKVKVKSTQ